MTYCTLSAWLSLLGKEEHYVKREKKRSDRSLQSIVTVIIYFGHQRAASQKKRQRTLLFS